jgi:hypothetical protein
MKILLPYGSRTTLKKVYGCRDKSCRKLNETKQLVSALLTTWKQEQEKQASLIMQMPDCNTKLILKALHTQMLRSMKGEELSSARKNMLQVIQ